MKKIYIYILVCALAQMSCAAWYWPFGSDDAEKKEPRVSELMEGASILIDEASDFAMDGKISEAVDAYKRALAELERIEAENPARAETASFATLRNKKAYVNAAIDSLHLKEAKQNARAIAVTDTAELEKKLAIKQGKIPAETKEEKSAVSQKEKAVVETPKTEEKKIVKKEIEKPKKESVRPKIENANTRNGRLKLAIADLQAKDYEAARLTIDALLEETPNDATALNLRAVVEAETGEYKAAEKTLDQAIQSNPRNYYAYYNMARVFLRSRGAEGKTSARRYYETGRSLGGPVNAGLEELLK